MLLIVHSQATVTENKKYKVLRHTGMSTCNKICFNKHDCISLGDATNYDIPYNIMAKHSRGKLLQFFTRLQMFYIE